MQRLPITEVASMDNHKQMEVTDKNMLGGKEMANMEMPEIEVDNMNKFGQKEMISKDRPRYCTVTPKKTPSPHQVRRGRQESARRNHHHL